MLIETLQVVECIPIENFKHKIKLTKEYFGKAKIEIIDDNYVYIDRIEEMKKN